jgi:hypothetical protein
MVSGVNVAGFSPNMLANATNAPGVRLDSAPGCPNGPAANKDKGLKIVLGESVVPMGRVPFNPASCRIGLTPAAAMPGSGAVNLEGNTLAINPPGIAPCGVGGINDETMRLLLDQRHSHSNNHHGKIYSLL